MTMEVLADWVSRISNVVWNGLLLYLLVGTGIVFTIRTRFIQVRKFGAGWKHLFGHFSLNGEKAGKDGMSPFQALTTAIAAQVGTGNIAGAATALYSGGPGAIFWMWLSAFFGMSTIYGEAVLAQKYKTTDDNGHVTGGPIYYIRARFTGNSASSLPASSRLRLFLHWALPATWYRQLDQRRVQHRVRRTDDRCRHHLRDHCSVHLPRRRRPYRIRYREGRSDHGAVLHGWLCCYPVHQSCSDRSGIQVHLCCSI